MPNTIAQIYAQVKADLEAQMQSQIPLIGKSMLRVYALVQASKIWLIYLAIELVQKNIFVDTADPESMGGTLQRFGRVKLNREPFQATAGEYLVTVTGTIGGIIPASQTFKSNDDSNSPNYLFILDNAYTLVATTDTITLRALTAGLDAKLVVGDKLTSTAPMAQVDSLVTVTNETIEPRAAEDLEDYRNATILAFQLEPQGGAGGDYTIWSADAQGVKSIYPYAKTGVFGEIDLYVEATIADSIDGNGTPSAQLLLDVEEVIERDPDTTKPLNERGRRPISAWQINYLPIIAQSIEINITGYVGLTAAKQTLIENGITDALAAIRPFVASRDVLANQNDFIDINKLIFIIQSSVPQSVFTSVDMEIDGTPLITYTFLGGNIPYLLQVNYL
jgi:uncharacterized phage protein gp47/JayE